MFETVIQGQAERTGRKRTVLVSLGIHALALGVLVVIPLVYYQTIPGGWEEIAKVFAPKLPEAVPPAPPPARTPASGPRTPTAGPVVVLSPILIEPGKVPPPPNALVIDMPFVPTGAGRGDGLPGGFVGEGLPNGRVLPDFRVIGPATPPPPPPRARKPPLLVSILDASRLVYRVEPVYPPLAITTRVQGTVMLHISVNEMGIVESVDVVSGHPLLVRAAVEAVKQWRYKPTILNGEPVPVKATVTVNFNLKR